MDAYSTISSPGELATYTRGAVNPLQALLGGGADGGNSQLMALLGNSMANKQRNADLEFKMKRNAYAQQLQQQISPPDSRVDNKRQPGQGTVGQGSYVKLRSGFGINPGYVQAYAGDPGAVYGGDQVPGAMASGAPTVARGSSSGPEMGRSPIPNYGAGQSAFGEQDDTDSRADWFGTGRAGSGKNQLAALMSQLYGK